MTDSRNTFDPLEALTVAQVGKLLSVSRPTVEKLIRQNELASMTIGRCRRVRRIDLEDFIERHRQYGWHSYRPGAARQEDYRYPANDLPDSGPTPF